jgi:hypothetical protein
VSIRVINRGEAAGGTGNLPVPVGYQPTGRLGEAGQAKDGAPGTRLPHSFRWAGCPAVRAGSPCYPSRRLSAASGCRVIPVFGLIFVRAR